MDASMEQDAEIYYNTILIMLHIWDEGTAELPETTDFWTKYIVARPTPYSLDKLISFSPLSSFLITSALTLEVLCLRLSELDILSTY
jgi:hypothetical protein